MVQKITDLLSWDGSPSIPKTTDLLHFVRFCVRIEASMLSELVLLNRNNEAINDFPRHRQNDLCTYVVVLHLVSFLRFCLSFQHGVCF